MKIPSLSFAARRGAFLTAATLSVANLALLAGCGATQSSVAQTVAAPDAAASVQTPTTPKVGDTAPDFELNELKGQKVKLSALTEQGPVVLMMLRGFPGYQCPLCTAQVGQFLGKAKELEKAGARVLMVYPGPADGLKAHADEFVRGKDMPAHFYLALDPDYSFTNQYKLRWDAPGETAYPATFVLDGKGKVLFSKVSAGHGDRAGIEEVLGALPK